jgi:hypothetical protein
MSDPPDWLAPPPPLPPPGAPPAPVPQTPDQAPPWAPQGPVRDYRWIPTVAGVILVLVLIVSVGWVLRNTFFSGELRTPPVYATPTPTPSGLELYRAETFWNTFALPALGEVNKTLPAIKAKCKGSLPAGCHDAIVATDAKMQQLITVINQGDVPACIATHVMRFKSDIEVMDGGLQIALNGYKAGDKDTISRGLAQFNEGALSVGPDTAFVSGDVKTLCH